MTNIFGRLLVHEFGRKKYKTYSQQICDKEVAKVFCDIYVELEGKEETDLNAMLLRLLETVHRSVAINRRFLYISIFYIFIASLIFLFFWTDLYMQISFALCTFCFLYKVWEFIRNRFCRRDIRLLLVYKSVLFHLISNDFRS